MKAQGATEYLVLMSVVLGITLICVAILVWPTGSSKDVKKSQTDIGIGINKIACAELAQGLVLHWKFNEGTGDTAYNSAGANMNDATLYNGTSWASGVRGKAVSFDGDGSYLMLNGTSNMPSSAITTAFWVKTSDNQGTLFSYASSNDQNEWLIYIGSPPITIYHGGGSTSTGITVQDGNWHHVVATWSDSGDAVQLYKDGALAYSGTRAGAPIIGNGCVTLGQDQDLLCGGFAAVDAFAGQLDDVRVYNRVLPPQEIELLYKNPECP